MRKAIVITFCTKDTLVKALDTEEYILYADNQWLERDYPVKGEYVWIKDQWDDSKIPAIQLVSKEFNRFNRGVK